MRDAPSLIKRGDVAALEKRIGSLPRSAVAGNPMLVYYLGLAKLFSAMGSGARAVLDVLGETAAKGFKCAPPVLVRTFGEFEVSCLGAVQRFGRKAQLRPLEMLKALAAFGGAASDTQLADAMWPESDGDAAKRSFDSTLHRLRRMIGHADAVLLSGGRLSLNPSVCVTDVSRFEHLLSALDAALAENDLESQRGCARQVLETYKGMFLKGEHYPWAVRARERLHFKFMSRVGMFGGSLERAARWTEAIALYLRVLDIDDTAEEFSLSVTARRAMCGKSATASAGSAGCSAP